MHDSDRMRVSLFYLCFAAVFGGGIALIATDLAFPAAVGAKWAGVEVPKNPGDFDSKAVLCIATTEELKAAISTGRCVLFVNCDWNPDMVAFRRPFSEFAVWAADEVGCKAVSVKLEGDATGDLWDAMESLWRANNISPGSMKTMGGAGRVVWFEDGNVVDYAWCADFSWVDDLRDRTKRVLR